MGRWQLSQCDVFAWWTTTSHLIEMEELTEPHFLPLTFHNSQESLYCYYSAGQQCSSPKCTFTSKTSHLQDELEIIHIPFFCLNELVNVALPFPLHRLHRVKALEVSTPYEKEAGTLDPTQPSDLMNYNNKIASTYTSPRFRLYTQWFSLKTLSTAAAGSKLSDVVIDSPPLCNFFVCHLFISLSILSSCPVMAKKNSWLPATPFVSSFSSSLPFFCHTVWKLWFSLTLCNAFCEMKSSRTCLGLTYNLHL